MDSKLTKDLADVFNIDINEFDKQLPAPIEEKLYVDDEDISECENDINLARSALRKLIDKNDGLITTIIRIAEESEHPRAFEVTAQLLRTQADNVKDLLELHKKKKELVNKSDGDEPNNITNNNILIATTNDILDQIKDKIKNES